MDFHGHFGEFLADADDAVAAGEEEVEGGLEVGAGVFGGEVVEVGGVLAAAGADDEEHGDGREGGEDEPGDVG